MTMNENSPLPKYPAFSNFMWASILLCLLGLGGLSILVSNALPTMGPRWLFYFLLMSAVSGVSLPVTYFLNRRFITRPPAEGGVIVREAIWAGIYACIAFWLQQGALFNPVLAVALGLGFVTIEFLLRVRELSLWKPKDAVDE
jgi:hypothetical protein